MTDDRIWRPDLLSVLDWGKVWEANQQSFGDNPRATWWVQATEGVNYYRALLPARHLPGKLVRFEDRDLQPDGMGEPWFPRQSGGAAIWMFPGNLTRWLCMAEMAVEQGLRVFAEMDDNYTCPPPTVPGIQSGWRRGKHDRKADTHSYDCHRRIVASEACHGIIVSTPKLADVYERFGKPIYVCPNSIDPEDWEPDPPHQADDVLRIGWAGSASHMYDVADIRPALDWASRQPGVEVVIIGQLDLGIEGARRVEWTDTLAEYRENARQIDVMLCPIRPGEWADCKSDVKALEGVMGGAMPVVSRTEPYRPWFDRTFVAEKPKDYVKIVKHLIANRDEVRSTYDAAVEYVYSERLITQSIDKWREALLPEGVTADAVQAAA